MVLKFEIKYRKSLEVILFIFKNYVKGCNVFFFKFIYGLVFCDFII